MKLYYAPASPFVRKVLVLGHETGLIDRLELQPAQVTPVSPDADLLRDNPLSKIPCLVTDDGLSLVDSRVICEYLDAQHTGKKLIPDEPARRWPVLRLAALCDEAADALVLARYETFVRPEEYRWSVWTDSLLAKAHRVLDAVEEHAGGYGERICIGTITLACLLGYLDFRFDGESWRKGRPALADWFERFAARPSMRMTMPS